MGTPVTMELLRERQAAKMVAEVEEECQGPFREPREGSKSAMLLEAAKAFAGRVFSTEELVVAAWLHCQAAFGLPGYEVQYPDSHTVKSLLYGKRGLIARRQLCKRDDGRLELP